MAKESTITKDYHFYTAHRNENLADKCQYLHGHTYYLKVCLKFSEGDLDPKTGVYINFNEVDSIMEPLVKTLDHATLVSKRDDELINCVLDYKKVFGKVVLMDGTTSVENLTEYITELILPTKIGKFLSHITIRETTTSEVTLNI